LKRGRKRKIYQDITSALFEGITMLIVKIYQLPVSLASSHLREMKVVHVKEGV
jgi:hypothetical protein